MGVTKKAMYPKYASQICYNESMHVEEVERKYWDADIAVENEMEKIVIQVTSSDEDTDTATECSDYSDTESADDECLC